ncbi:uncharacterized protein LOC129737624 [Uranotaenia lowii]|uniref:uncharacterized protein LOC129737624 n=1 Tax=Uranotaenia lowii TaxID=190385 RepID=UPI002478F6EF|nr:uncharacterized protein LOC129737624 [Uranotaenia lowii]
MAQVHPIRKTSEELKKEHQWLVGHHSGKGEACHRAYSDKTIGGRLAMALAKHFKLYQRKTTAFLSECLSASSYQDATTRDSHRKTPEARPGLTGCSPSEILTTGMA